MIFSAEYLIPCFVLNMRLLELLLALPILGHVVLEAFRLGAYRLGAFRPGACRLGACCLTTVYTFRDDKKKYFR